ncbi:hypothetical protein [Myroides sp. LJL119]
MKELDLLKKHWNQQQNFPKISAQEITKMIHKKSSSIVKWIFVISILEFIILNIFSQLTWKEDDFGYINKSYLLFIIQNIDIFSAVISCVFIVFFYFNFRKISAADSTKRLMQQIIYTKRTVNYYIWINILFCCVFFVLIMFSTLSTKNYTTSYYLLGAVITIFTLLLFAGVIWLYYRVVYGLLIKKLMKNYKELEKIDLE